MLLSWTSRNESTAIPTDHVIMDALTCLFGHSTTKSVHVLLALGTEVIFEDGRSGKGAIDGAMRHLDSKTIVDCCVVVVWMVEQSRENERKKVK